MSILLSEFRALLWPLTHCTSYIKSLHMGWYLGHVDSPGQEECTTPILMPIHAIICGTILSSPSAYKSISPVVNTTICVYSIYSMMNSFTTTPTLKQMSASTTYMYCSLGLQTFPSNLQLEDLNCLHKSTDRKHIV